MEEKKVKKATTLKELYELKDGIYSDFESLQEIATDSKRTSKKDEFLRISNNIINSFNKIIVTANPSNTISSLI